MGNCCFKLWNGMGVQVLRQPPSGEKPISTIIKSGVEATTPWGLLHQMGVFDQDKKVEIHSTSKTFYRTKEAACCFSVSWVVHVWLRYISPRFDPNLRELRDIGNPALPLISPSSKAKLGLTTVSIWVAPSTGRSSTHCCPMVSPSRSWSSSTGTTGKSAMAGCASTNSQGSCKSVRVMLSQAV